MGYEVFISFKRNKIGGGGVTRDYYLAKDLYQTLTDLGLKVFFSEKDISTAVFINQINQGLSEAKILIVVGTSCANMESQYVQYEWGSFHNEILNGNKSGCEIYTYLEGMDPREAPLTLRRLDSFNVSQKEKLVQRIFYNLRHTSPQVNVAPAPKSAKAKLAAISVAAVALLIGGIIFASVVISNQSRGSDFSDNNGYGTYDDTELYDDDTETYDNEDDSDSSSSEGFSDLFVGTHFSFGSYPQNSSSPESIEWRVLAVENGRALVISEKSLDCVKYNSSRSSVTWSNCSLRTWMNGTFLNTAFSSGDQSLILTSTVTTPSNSKFNTYGGESTQDKIFALSAQEARKYFSGNDDRKAEVTSYAISRGSFVHATETVNGMPASWWYLRTPGSSGTRSSHVTSGGSVYDEGDFVNLNNGSVRPAMWVKTK